MTKWLDLLEDLLKKKEKRLNISKADWIYKSFFRKLLIQFFLHRKEAKRIFIKKQFKSPSMNGNPFNFWITQERNWKLEEYWILSCVFLFLLWLQSYSETHKTVEWEDVWNKMRKFIRPFNKCPLKRAL